MAEKEYIEREALFRAIENIPDNELLGTDNTTFVELPTVLDIISEQPTADVQEVGHAEWVLQENKHPEAVCSNCGREVVYQIVNNRWEFENYCPHCGAKMDKE